MFCFLLRNQAKKDKLLTKNTRILCKLQSSLTNASFSGLSTSANLLLLHQVFICGTQILPQLRQFWNTFQIKLGDKGPYQASIGVIRLRLQELQESNSKAQEIKVAGLKEGWEKIDRVLHYQRLPYMPRIVCSKLISKHHNDSLAGHFGVNKIRELIGWKYYWPNLRKDVETYIKGCDIYLTLKTVR